MAQVFQGGLLEAQADFLRDHLATGQHGDILQHGLAPIAEARRLDGGDLHDAADVVHHQGGQGFALDVLGNDQQRPAGLRHAFQQRQHVADVRDLLVVQENQRIFQFDALALRRVDEVR